VPAADAAGPLGDAEIAALFAPVAGVARIALAVSGGADSLALLDCADRWRRASGTTVVVLTVDHRLRPGSAREAAAVAAMARARGIAAHVLTWHGGCPASGIEAAARMARYGLLLGAAREIGASHLLVAHHREDQAETFLMRLKRGAGLFGLAAMRPAVEAGGVTILRPFLGVARARLRATTSAAGLVAVEDPMNDDPRFERVRLRRVMTTFAGDGVDAARLAALAERCAAAAATIERAADRLIAEAVEVDACAAAQLDPAGFLAARSQVRRRALVRLLVAVGGGDYPPRSQRLDDLAEAMVRHGGRGRFKRTLAATVIEWRAGRFFFYRELGRGRLSAVPVEAGLSRDWDRRFRIEVSGPIPPGLSLAALEEAGRRQIGLRAGAAPAGALAALPAVWCGAEILAVPAIGYRAGGPFGAVITRPILAERLARSPMFPDFAARDPSTGARPAVFPAR
jgi:tRNA(Ile)-lysidine synthase